MALVRQKADPTAIRQFTLESKLISAAKLDKAFPQYVPMFVNDLIKYIHSELLEARNDPNAHSDDKLIKIAGHTCTIESTHENLTNMINSLEALDPVEDASAIADVKRGYYQAIARTLAYGFDKVEENKLVRDASGRVTAITEERLAGTECARALLAPNPEPFGGKRKKHRKTKKRNMKKRKTLRRVRH